MQTKAPLRSTPAKAARSTPFQSISQPRRHNVRCASKGASSEDAGVSRREVMVSPLMLSSLAAFLAAAAPAARAEEAVAAADPVQVAEVPAPATPAAPAPAPAAPSTAGKMKELSDDILAYKFSYPVSTMSGKPLSMILSHAPEKYSSAAPLTADARQRIVSELLDLRNFVTVSMTVGPASGVLKEKQQQDWKPYDVALTVLVDRSTSRLTSGQRTAQNNVEEAHVEDRGGSKYWVYEHVSQGSPTLLEANKRETYRHALAATTVRPDNKGVPYLYTLNLSCRQEMWDDLLPLFKEAINSYRLTPTTDKYIAPDVNPWQFW